MGNLPGDGAGGEGRAWQGGYHGNLIEGVPRGVMTVSRARSSVEREGLGGTQSAGQHNRTLLKLGNDTSPLSKDLLSQLIISITGNDKGDRALYLY